MTDKPGSEAALREERDTLESLYRVAQYVAAELDSDKVLQHVTDAATKMCGAQIGVFLPSGTPSSTPPLGSMLEVPVVSRSGESFGKLFLGHAEPNAFLPRCQRVAEALAVQAAIALDNARLFSAAVDTERDLRKTHDQLEQRVVDRTAELASANERLREVDRLKSEFLATMSHELRTPLNSIIGFTTLIAQGASGSINEEQDKQLKIVLDSANHLLALINDILDVARIESGKTTIEFSRFPVRLLAAQVVDAITPRLRARGLQIEMEGPDVEVETDHKKLMQVLLNLLDNAVKFTPKGSVGLHWTVRERRLEMRVSDTGIGIRPEDQDKLFQPFRQVDSSSQRHYEGTGLGLYLCRKFMELVGGTIDVESEHGKGSSFVVTVPLGDTVVSS